MHPLGRPAPAAARAIAWGGALLFALALGYFLYTYAFTFGESLPGQPSLRTIAWNIALFSVFALHHSLFARERVRDVVARTVPPQLERSLYVWIASLLLIAVCALWRPVAGVAWQIPGIAALLLWIVMATGVWLTLTSAAAIDVWELAGVRQTESPEIQSPKPKSHESRSWEFKTSGPYGWVRHPIYLGWCLIVFAVPRMTMTRLVFAAVSGAYLLIAIPLEERSLRTISGGAYDEYMKRVRWRLVPGLY